jgi:4-hydroxybenzoyl-CoA thioesterase
VASLGLRLRLDSKLITARLALLRNALDSRLFLSHMPAISNLEPPLVSYLTFRRQVTIGWGHCDPAGMVLGSRLFELFDESAWLLFHHALGVPPAKITETFGVTMPLVDVRGRFILPVKWGDEAELTATIGEFRRSSFDVKHELRKDGQLAAEGQETRVWAAREPDDRLRARPLPPEVIERFKLN